MSKQHPNVKALREHKRYLLPLRGGGMELIHPEAAIAALDWAVRVCEAADNLVNVKGRHHAEVAYRRLEEAVNGDRQG